MNQLWKTSDAIPGRMDRGQLSLWGRVLQSIPIQDLMAGRVSSEAILTWRPPASKKQRSPLAAATRERNRARNRRQRQARRIERSHRK